MIRITDIRLPFDHAESALTQSVCNILNIPQTDILELAIFRKSIDARKKHNILNVYTVDVKLQNEEVIPMQSNQVSHVDQAEYIQPAACKPLPHNPVIVGTGPAGLFAGLLLAQAGLKPILIERGKEVTSRIKDVNRFWNDGTLDTESNVQFGEGGAGTFSDGKLTTQIKDKSNRIRKILTEFVNAGAPEEILYNAKPHIGTDNLIKIVKSIRRQIISLGGQVRFQTKLTSINITNGKVTAAVVNDSEAIETDTVVLAIGHSARDTFTMLKDADVAMQAKPFSIGVRIEHPQSLIDKSQFGEFASHKKLPAADYKLVAHCPNGRSAYTFCMCPGGEVIASSSQQGGLVVNGMSRYKRNAPNANSALLVGVTPEDFNSEDPLVGIEFQEKWERKAFEVGGRNYNAPAQLAADFLAGKKSTSLGKVKPSYKPGITLCDLSNCLPDFVTQTLRLAIPLMDNKLKGFALPDAIMTALESRSSSPVRILRDENLQSVSTAGLYPAGEGAGYAGGIMSAAVDGIKIAEAIIASDKR